MIKEDFLKYLNASNEYRASVNFNSYTEYKVFLRFDKNSIYLHTADNKKSYVLEYGKFTKEQFDLLVDELEK
jgi:LPS O-antigen subunit length determinant protein (WzzB/FepE family)